VNSYFSCKKFLFFVPGYNGQLAAEEKRNEITAEPKLLDMVFREARVSGTDGEWGAESEYTEREFDRETKVRRTLVRYYANSFE
jgi:hypothetical protein